MNWKDKLAKANQLYAEVKAILANPESTDEDKAQIEQMMADAEKLRAEATQLKKVEAFGVAMATEAEEEARQEEDKAKEGRKDPTEFKDWAEFLQAAHNAGNPQFKAPPDPRLQFFKDEGDGGGMEDKQMVESIGASGGFLVPTEFLAQLQAVQGELGIVRNRATIIRMRRRAIQIPVLDQTATGVAGRPSWFGGMYFYWAAEAKEKTYTEPHFRQVELVAHKLIGYTRASDELLDDSAISLADFLSGPMGMAGGISWMEDYAFLRGSGAGQPLGVITAVNQPTIVVARAVAGQINIADLANMRASFLPSGQGVWVVTQSAMASMIQLAGPAGNPAYWWQPSGREGVPDVLLGLPVIWSEKMPALGVQGDILLADFRYYLLGDRQATTIESTQYDYWRYDQTSWRAVHRVDGQPWLSAPLTYQDQATTVSPFVILGGVGAS